MQHRFNIKQVNQPAMKALDEPTIYFTAICFQLGCSIGELIAMGLTKEQVLESCNNLIEEAVKTRLSVNTKGCHDGTA